MKKTLVIILVILLLIASVFYFINRNKNQLKVSSINKSREIDRPLERYSIENLAKTNIPEGKITIKEKIEEKETFDSYIFEFQFNPNLDQKTIKKTSGLINIPKGKSTFPLVIMIRGYVDPKIYKTGTGSKNMSYFLAEKGFITIAPDFLGYADSDREAENIFESRFQTYTTILSLIKSVEDIEKWDRKNIFIWGHSNGGQIALYTLEVSEKNIPTVLWAPVSKPFPYSILYYTDEAEDKGKFIRKELAKFEELYDVDKYSTTNYFNRINSPLLIIQGTGDDAVPEKWSKELSQKLEKIGKKVKYQTYTEADHNLRPRWNEAAENTLEFFIKNLTKD
jgi:dipeptidyl aminopeptidase/acylaminoacyl peptidase